MSFPTIMGLITYYYMANIVINIQSTMPNMILFRKLYRSFAKGRKHKKEPPKQLFLAVSNNYRLMFSIGIYHSRIFLKS